MPSGRQGLTVDQRLDELKHWLANDLALGELPIEPASGDASFRRYFRVTGAGRTYIAMDAPPDREDSAPFVTVARLFFDLGLNVPEILAQDEARGFYLLSDLGNRMYLDELNEGSVERLYGDALDALMVIQARGPDDDRLPPYDRELLLREMELFREWYVGRHLEIGLSAAQHEVLTAMFDRLADSALEQPAVCVHRDYHSRNLMRVEWNNPGILDFQDAVVGPITYDLVSLLRDCYVAWPRERVEQWALGYFDQAVQSGLLRDEHGDHFLRWFDWMGVQRHLKATGIFARLNHRDGKAGYLGDIPRTFAYMQDVCGRYPDLSPLADLLLKLSPD